MSAAYWIAFLTISTIALVPLLTAAVLEAFNESNNDKRVEQDVFRLSYETAKKYSELWANADPERTMYLPEREVVRIIAQLPQPLGTDMTIQDAAERPKSCNPLRGNCFGRRRVLTSMQSSSSLIPAQLGAASALLHSLPIVLDSGRIHFHALLQVGGTVWTMAPVNQLVSLPPMLFPQALVDHASERPPLGAPTLTIALAHRGATQVQATMRQIDAVRRLQARWRRHARSRSRRRAGQATVRAIIATSAPRAVWVPRPVDSDSRGSLLGATDASFVTFNPAHAFDSSPRTV